MEGEKMSKRISGTNQSKAKEWQSSVIDASNNRHKPKGNDVDGLWKCFDSIQLTMDGIQFQIGIWDSFWLELSFIFWFLTLFFFFFWFFVSSWFGETSEWLWSGRAEESVGTRATAESSPDTPLRRCVSTTAATSTPSGRQRRRRRRPSSLSTWIVWPREATAFEAQRSTFGFVFHRRTTPRTQCDQSPSDDGQTSTMSLHGTSERPSGIDGGRLYLQRTGKSTVFHIFHRWSNISSKRKLCNCVYLLFGDLRQSNPNRVCDGFSNRFSCVFYFFFFRRRRNRLL